MSARQLYQCLNAKVSGKRISCDKGYKLTGSGDGTLPVHRLIRGTQMEMTICKDCPDYDEMGPSLLSTDRGYLEAFTTSRDSKSL